MLAEVTPIVGHEFVPVRSALGRILAADIIAPHDVPAHDNSAMDGYAVHFDSLSGTGETRLAMWSVRPSPAMPSPGWSAKGKRYAS
jgi:molybdopterin molybdotransferase